MPDFTVPYLSIPDESTSRYSPHVVYFTFLYRRWNSEEREACEGLGLGGPHWDNLRHRATKSGLIENKLWRLAPPIASSDVWREPERVVAASMRELMFKSEQLSRRAQLLRSGYRYDN